MNKAAPQINLINSITDEFAPKQAEFELWADTLSQHLRQSPNTSINIAIITTQQSQALNQKFRQKDRPTNVLSFPDHSIPGDTEDSLGDLAICASVVNQEARDQQINAIAHWAHMTIHGMLHLLGFDHEEKERANQMETTEVAILSTLGYPNPYQ